MPRPMAISRNGGFQAHDLVCVDGIASAEGVAAHLVPEWALPKMDAAPAEVVLQESSLPKIVYSSDWEEARHLPEQQSEDGAS
jgi:hypothetical protein